MVTKNKSSSAFIAEEEVEEEEIAYQRLVKELDFEVDDVWVDAIYAAKENDEQNNLSGSWVVEDNNDALSEYVDDVSDFISPEDINNLDW